MNPVHHLFSASARIRCAESGHMWNDASFFLVHWMHKPVLERVQKCERVGCNRTRTDRVSPSSLERVSRVYGGKIERLGRVTRQDMLKEIIG